MLRDDGLLRHEGGRWVATGDIGTLRAPDSIQALLSARLDRLSDEERLVIRSASVVGKVFSWGAVAHLVPESAPGGPRDPPADTGPQGPDPPRAVHPSGRGRVPLPSHPHPGGCVPRHIQGGPGGTSRGVRRVGREDGGRPGERARGGDRVPPGAGLPAAVRARSEGRAGAGPRAPRGAPARRGRDARVRSARRLRRLRPVAAGAELLPLEHPERRRVLLALGEALAEIGDLGLSDAALDEAGVLAASAGDAGPRPTRRSSA